RGSDERPQGPPARGKRRISRCLRSACAFFPQRAPELHAEILDELVQFFGSRAGRCEDQLAAVASRSADSSRLGKHRADPFAGLDDALHEHDVGFADSEPYLDELVPEQRRKPLFAVHGTRSYTRRVSEASDETEPLQDPPPVGDVEEPAGSGDFTELLHSFEGDSDLDDSVSEELDAGVSLGEDELPVGDEVGPLLDIGEMVQSREDEDPSGVDELGPAGEPALGLFEDASASEFDDDDAEDA